MRDHVIGLLADYCSDLKFDDIPTAIVDSAAERLVDTIGCALGAMESEPTVIARSVAHLVDPQRTGHPARWLGETERITDIESAGFVNSTMIRYLDFNDTVPRGGHPSDSLGPLLAHADAHRMSGRELITAVVAAYDVFIRCVTATKLRERGWDQGFGVGLAVAAGMSKLLGLDRPTTRHALAIAAVANVPLRATRAGRLSTWKGMAAAFAARSAYASTLLAAAGATGPQAPIDGRHGLKELVTGPFDFHPLTGTGRFLTPSARLKYWPVESHLQPVVWAAIELGKAVSLDEVARVEIAASWSAWHETGSEPDKWDPQTRETADHSLPYVFVRSMQAGALDVSAFEPGAYLDAAVRPEMAKISVSVDDEIEGRFAEDVVLRVAATSHDGTRHEVEIVNPRGHDKNPLTGTEVGDKFRRLVAPRTGPERAESALDWLRQVSNADDVSVGLDLLAVGI